MEINEARTGRKFTSFEIPEQYKKVTQKKKKKENYKNLQKLNQRVLGRNPSYKKKMDVFNFDLFCEKYKEKDVYGGERNSSRKNIYSLFCFKKVHRRTLAETACNLPKQS